MDISRISTYNTHQSTLFDATNVQAELYKLQGQISSGLKAETFSDLNGQVEAFTSLDNRLRRTDYFVQQNSLTDTKLKTISNVLSQTIDIANDTKNLLNLRRSTTNENSLAFEERLNGLWGAFSAQLNTNADGRYIFSGTRTDQKPVNTDFPILEVNGVPDDSYYQGSKENISFRVQDDYEFEQSVRADDPSFQKFVAAFALARQGNAENDDAKLKQAFDEISSAINGVIDLQANVNTQSININSASDRLESVKIYWKGVREGLINTDLVSATTEVAINQGILQASFQAFARINQLKLSDYLR